MHIKNLKPDYSDFHGPTQYSNLGVGSIQKGYRSAAVYYIIGFIMSSFINVPGQNQVETLDTKLTDTIDARAVSLYERNVGLIIDLCQLQNITPIIIPQILNFHKLTGDSPDLWTPLIRAKHLKNAIAVYNNSLKNICKKKKVVYGEKILSIDFTDDDFIDGGHFSQSGNNKFSRVIAETIKQH